MVAADLKTGTLLQVVFVGATQKVTAEGSLCSAMTLLSGGSSKPWHPGLMQVDSTNIGIWCAAQDSYSHTSVLVGFRIRQTLSLSHFDEKKYFST